MSTQQETLFSFELLVDFILLERQCEAQQQLAVGIRLLDFPTLLIYQPQHTSSINKRGEFAFHRGKSCFFKMNLDSLCVHLSNTPLYAMVLDVKEETPKLLGSSLVSLSNTVERIRQDVTERGVSSPSSHTEKGLTPVCSLKGEKIGSISLSYKLLCLGASLLPRITEKRGLKSSVAGGEHNKEGDKSTLSLNPTMAEKSGHGTNTHNQKEENPKLLSHEERQDDTVLATEDDLEEDVNVFFPPQMYYTNSAQERMRTQVEDWNYLNTDSEPFPFEDSWSEDESKVEGQRFPAVTKQNVRCETERSRDTSNVLGDALRRMPVLNALLVELSQLNIQNLQQSSNVHPSVGRMYSPKSPEPSAGCVKTSSKPTQRLGPDKSLHSRHFHSPRNCSTPIAQSACLKQENKQEERWNESKSCSKSPRKKLHYGTTKTFNLRLKQVCPPKEKHRECAKLQQNETQSKPAKGKMKANHRTTKSGKRKTCLKQSLNENVETVIQSVTVDSALQGTVTLNKKSQPGKVHGKQGGEEAARKSAKPPSSKRDLKCIHIPSAADGDDVPRSKDEERHHSESDQSPSEFDSHPEKIESSGSSRRDSTESSRSEEVDYADDFNSLGPSDAFSPDPASSPELSRAKTPKSPLHLHLSASDSGSEGVQRRVVPLPEPIKTPSSPRRVLKGTHVIRPRVHTSALSFSSSSSDVDDKEKTASSQTRNTRKQVTVSSSGAESFKTQRGQRGESSESIGPVRGLSAGSTSSVEPREAEELGDELGSLDFRKEYQHISQLVASKLPGYTM